MPLLCMFALYLCKLLSFLFHSTSQKTNIRLDSKEAGNDKHSPYGSLLDRDTNYKGKSFLPWFSKMKTLELHLSMAASFKLCGSCYKHCYALRVVIYYCKVTLIYSILFDCNY